MSADAVEADLAARVALIVAGKGQADESEEKTQDRYQELTERLVDANDLHRLPPPEPLVVGVMDRDSSCWLHGKAGHGKSFVALDLACHIAAGSPWRGRDVFQGRVLYLVAEGATGMVHRVKAWEQGNATRLPRGQVLFLPIAVQMLDTLDVDAFRQVVKDVDPVLIVIDTQARVTVGGEENSSKDMGRLVAAVDSLRVARRSTVMVVHHEGRAGSNMRGSTAMEGAGDTVLRVTKDGVLVTLSCEKQKDQPEFDPPIYGTLLPAGRSVYWSHSTVGLSLMETETETKIFGTLWDQFGTNGASNTQLLEATGLARSSYQRGLTSLVRKGKVHNIGSPKRTCYVLSDEEQTLLDIESPT